jgi:hypothetical protein
MAITRIQQRFACILILVSVMGGCSISSTPSTTDLETPALGTISVEQMPDGSKLLRKADGWQIPVLDIGKEETRKVIKKTRTGVEISVDLSVYRPEFGRILVPPDAEANLGMGALNIQTISRYEAKGRPFAYSFLVNRVEIDGNSNLILSSQGVVFRFNLYDEDGDGLFDTLGLSEPRLPDSMLPHVPDWIILLLSKVDG